MANILKILLVEDNPGDVELTREVLTSTERQFELQVAEDGIKAIAYLESVGDDGNKASPDLILLDLNLPGRDGRQILADIKGNKRLKQVPVVVISSSDADNDVVQSYNLGANSFVTKPKDLGTYRSTIKGLERYWSDICTLPSGVEPTK